jgi:hypothetical protein
MTASHLTTLRDILEIALSMARTPDELLQWGKDNAEVINQEMRGDDMKHLRKAYLDKMQELKEREINGDKV